MRHYHERIIRKTKEYKPCSQGSCDHIRYRPSAFALCKKTSTPAPPANMQLTNATAQLQHIAAALNPINTGTSKWHES